jgi:hypothetical protein
MSAVAIAAASVASAVPQVRFESFEYAGADAVFAGALAPGHFRNPILAGFYPDPDICRVGNDYYTAVAGGFVGALGGLHARTDPEAPQKPMLMPPSTGRITPVTNSAAGDAR